MMYCILLTVLLMLLLKKIYDRIMEKTKRREDLIYNLKNHVNCRIKQSKTHGVGVFTFKNIPKNTVLFKVPIPASNTDYVELTKDEVKKMKLHPEVLKILVDFTLLGDTFEVPVNGPNDYNIIMYLNESKKKPNVEYYHNNDHICATYKTIRDIKAGEELLVTYDD